MNTNSNHDRVGFVRDARALLKADHAKVKRMFTDFCNADTEMERQALAKIIYQEWIGRSGVEEISYPSTYDPSDEMLD